MQSDWRSYAMSGLAHICAGALLLALTVPVVEQTRRPLRRVVLVAPVLRHPIFTAPERPRYEAKPALPRIASIPATAPTVARESPRPATHVATQSVAPAPESPPQAVALEIPQSAPPPLVAELPVAPKVEVRTGTFDRAAAPAGTIAQGAVSVGAFGNGNSANATGDGAGRPGAVRLGSFGQQTTPSTEGRPARASQNNLYTPVEILFKPRPVYTTDARDARIEGEVSLEVVFLATGEIRVGRVLRGLGHGLDQAAQQAAAQVRFKPARRDGVPVDTPATIRITFALT